MAQFAPDPLNMPQAEVLNHNALKTVEVVTQAVTSLASQFDLTQKS
jgi:hypothetical protein